jgi:GNAT superfamily N-acetyltransferase
MSREGYTVRVGDIDPALVHRWLASDSYWAADRPLERVARSLANSLVHVLVDPAGEPVGLARAVTDHTTFAWLCDVYLLPAHRGRGLGRWLVDGLLRALREAGVGRVMLATRDAHGLYAQLGFTGLVEPYIWMELAGR